MNIAAGTALGEDMQHIYLRLIDEFTASHVVILDFLWRSAGQISKLQGNMPQNRSFQQILDELLPQFTKEHQLVDQIVGDLRSRGFATLQSMSSTFLNR